LNQSRHYHSVTVLDNRYLYVIGGRDSLTEAPLDTIERLDGFAGALENQKWENVPLINKDQQWSARDTLGSFALMDDSEILIFGGDYGWISDCFVFNTKTNEIQKHESTLKKPEEFFRSQPVRYNDKVFVLGNLDKDVHVYSLKGQKWFMLDKWFIDW
jgi:Kelch motif